MKKWFSGFAVVSFLLMAFASGSLAAPADDRDCPQFSSNQEVMQFWYDNGYSASNDPHDLDRDNDGAPCEVSSSEYNDFVASQESNDSTSNSNDSTSENTDSSSDSTSEDQSNANTQQSNAAGEKMPDTATNDVGMIGMAAVMAAAGGALLIRRKKVKE
ncbi:excalibur calcium-binding domain-containing protein [Domibacillus indicus]|uniref:excalibur calcium-binding domain-containing protein n=1 Tax=Domibacillus indicus TaxID=1437523 RepID=UPI00203B477F|nr:excalibur calcium-binding domain-containing protein [Domibacillus indicus]MCM3790334.1 excalibur calcium-binding domain-containing protein [Domibacillus indicus]